MKNYKGLYYKEDKLAPNYEHGAHFKYSELVNALKQLQNELYSRIDIQNMETNYSPIKSDIILFNGKFKRSKKNKLKEKILLYDEKNENKRYRDTENINDLEKNYIESKNIKDEKDETEKNENLDKKMLFKSHKNIFNRKRNKDEQYLPKINTNNNYYSISLKKSLDNKIFEDKIDIDKENDNKNVILEYNIKNIDLRNNINIDIQKQFENKKSKKNKDNINKFNSNDVLPKINSSYYNQITQENENKKKYKSIEEQNYLKDTIEESSIKKYHHYRHYHNKSINKNISKLLIKNNNIFGSEIQKKRNDFNSYKLKSIFETEKQIKNNNLQRNERNLYKKNYIETIDNDMAKHIYHLKKNLLNDNNKNF